jgi:hypothetical protein
MTHSGFGKSIPKLIESQAFDLQLQISRQKGVKVERKIVENQLEEGWFLVK